MSLDICSKIVATGSYIPKRIVKNSDFLINEFFDTNGEKVTRPNEITIEKFEEITGIFERRYVDDDLVTSDIAYLAAKDALESSGIDKETLDYIIVAHNFGDVKFDNRKSDIVPSIASRIKNHLRIFNPFTVAYDLVFGCPGWLQGVIQADIFIKSGYAKKVMVIGTETLSRVYDPHDRDCMIYSDGAGAVILEAVESSEPVGVLSHASRSDTIEHNKMLWMDKSFNQEIPDGNLFLKMHGHHLYKYALLTVPGLVKFCLDKAELTLTDIKKVFIHQANNKMDEEILKRLFNLYDVKSMEQSHINDIMPMTISWLGNSSVATLPTLIDLLLKGKLDNHSLSQGDIASFTSVGAGMNINCMIYKF